MKEMKCTFNAENATRLAVNPTNTHTNKPFLTNAQGAQQNPIAEYLMCETSAYLSYCVLLAKTTVSPCQVECDLGFLAMRASFSTLPFHAMHEARFGWVRGLAASHLSLRIPNVLWSKTTVEFATPSRNIQNYAMEYVASLCEAVGEIVYDLTDIEKLFSEVLHLSLTDAEEITDLYLRYLLFAMRSFQKALREPVPSLVAYPYEISVDDISTMRAPIVREEDEEEDAQEDEDEFVFLPVIYVPSIDCYDVWNGMKECYEMCEWNVEKALFEPMFADDVDLMALVTPEKAQTEEETKTAEFLHTIEEVVRENAHEEDFVPLDMIVFEDAVADFDEDEDFDDDFDDEDVDFDDEDFDKDFDKDFAEWIAQNTKVTHEKGASSTQTQQLEEFFAKLDAAIANKEDGFTDADWDEVL